MKRIAVTFILLVMSMFFSSCSLFNQEPLTYQTNSQVQLQLEVDESHVNISDTVELMFSASIPLFANKISFEFVDDTANVSIEEIFIDNYAHYYLTASEPGSVKVIFKYDDQNTIDSEPLNITWSYGEISTYEELIGINNSDDHYKLVNDIDCAGFNVDPIDSFSGVLDGNGYQIKNIYISDNNNNIGLFRSLEEDGVLQNLIINNLVVESIHSSSNVGGLVGVNHGEITQVLIANSTINTPNASNVGGLVGQNNGNISHIESYTQVIGLENVGGIIGLSQNHTIGNLENHGNVRGYNQSENLGGVIGYMVLETNEVISNLTNHGQVQGDTSIGGVVGKMSANISALINYGNVSSLYSGNNVGGITGTYLPILEGSVSQVSNHGDVYGYANIGGLFGHIDSILDEQYDHRVISLSSLTNYGKVQAEDINAGGIIGLAELSRWQQYIYDYYWYEAFALTDIQNEGQIQGLDYVGGIAGALAYLWSSSNVSNQGDIISEGAHVNELYGNE